MAPVDDETASSLISHFEPSIVHLNSRFAYEIIAIVDRSESVRLAGNKL
jgi:hypothetical protein